MDKRSAGLCAGGQFARGDVLEAFDDGLRRVSTGMVNMVAVYRLAGAVVSDDQRQRGNESGPSAFRCEGLGCVLEDLWVLLSKGADAQNGELVDCCHFHAASSRWAVAVGAGDD